MTRAQGPDTPIIRPRRLSRRWAAAIVIILALVVILSLMSFDVNHPVSGKMTTENVNAGYPCYLGGGSLWVACITLSFPGSAQVSITWQDTSGGVVSFQLGPFCYETGAAGKCTFDDVALQGSTEVVIVLDSSGAEGAQTVVYSGSVLAPIIP